MTRLCSSAICLSTNRLKLFLMKRQQEEGNSMRRGTFVLSSLQSATGWCTGKICSSHTKYTNRNKCDGLFQCKIAHIDIYSLFHSRGKDMHRIYLLEDSIRELSREREWAIMTCRWKTERQRKWTEGNVLETHTPVTMTQMKSSQDFLRCF